MTASIWQLDSGSADVFSDVPFWEQIQLITFIAQVFVFALLKDVDGPCMSTDATVLNGSGSSIVARVASIACSGEFENGTVSLNGTSQHSQIPLELPWLQSYDATLRAFLVIAMVYNVGSLLLPRLYQWRWYASKSQFTRLLQTFPRRTSASKEMAMLVAYHAREQQLEQQLYDQTVGRTIPASAQGTPLSVSEATTTRLMTSNDQPTASSAPSSPERRGSRRVEPTGSTPFNEGDMAEVVYRVNFFVYILTHGFSSTGYHLPLSFSGWTTSFKWIWLYPPLLCSMTNTAWQWPFALLFDTVVFVLWLFRCVLVILVQRLYAPLACVGLVLLFLQLPFWETGCVLPGECPDTWVCDLTNHTLGTFNCVFPRQHVVSVWFVMMTTTFTLGASIYSWFKAFRRNLWPSAHAKHFTQLMSTLGTVLATEDMRDLVISKEKMDRFSFLQWTLGKKRLDPTTSPDRASMLQSLASQLECFTKVQHELQREVPLNEYYVANHSRRRTTVSKNMMQIIGWLLFPSNDVATLVWRKKAGSRHYHASNDSSLAHLLLRHYLMLVVFLLDDESDLTLIREIEHNLHLLQTVEQQSKLTEAEREQTRVLDTTDVVRHLGRLRRPLPRLSFDTNA
eukprot:m.367702 g.367702  ORF g.367702 m.367702 type:complete len:623 (+) comp42222_c0_seq1:229-2097(+)